MFRFCHMCLLKYLVQYAKKCPLCRTPILQFYEDFKPNVTLDYISRKFNTKVSLPCRTICQQYMKIK